MSGVRYFSGGRTTGKNSAASDLVRFELRKKGKLPPGERYKRIMKKRLEEAKSQALAGKVKSFKLPGSIGEAHQMSKKAEEALKQMAAKKAAKQAKAERQMVIIQPRNYYNGSLSRKGQIYDVAGNVIGNVNKKNGKMTTNTGWGFGMYKPGRYTTNVNIQNAINTYSPYFINLRKMQAMQAGMVDPATDGGVYGETYIAGHHATHFHTPHQHQNHGYVGLGSGGDDSGGSPRAGGGVTAWGFMSDNVWGINSDNVWGTMADNVWGGTESNIWGGVADAGGWWGWKGPKVWNTGNGNNYIKGITNFLSALFGVRLHKGNVSLSEHIRAARSSGNVHQTQRSTSRSGGEHATTRSSTTRTSSSSGTRSSSSTRSGGSSQHATVRSAPTRTGGKH